MDLLRALAGGSAALIDEDSEAAQTLLETFGYLPLAVELAGKQLALKGRKPGFRLQKLLQGVLAQLDSGLALPGHPGLAAAFAESHDALNPEHQRLVRQLGIFVSRTLSLDALAGVLGRDEAEVEAGLDELVFPALLDYGQVPGNYVFHPLLRRYARNLLSTAGEEASAQRQHLAYYLAFAQAHAQNEVEAHDRLEAALPELLAAAEYAGRVDAFDEVNSFAIALSGDSEFLANRGYARESLSLLTAAVDACRHLDDRRNEGNHMGNLGYAHVILGEVEEAVDYFKQSLAIAQEVENRRGEGRVLSNLGGASLILRQARQAIDYYQQALDIAREIEDRPGEASRLGGLASAHAARGEVEKAIEYYQQALSISREVENRQIEGRVQGSLGSVHAALGQMEEAIDHYQQALAIAREIGDRRGEESRLGGLAKAHEKLGQTEQAISYYEEALATARQMGDRNNEALYAWRLGLLYEEREPARAVALMSILVEYRQEIGHADAGAYAKRLRQLKTRLQEEGE